MPWLNCRICNNKFYARPRHIKVGWGKYCSKKCQFEAQRTGKFVACAYCDERVYRIKSELGRPSVTNRYFCNRGCHCAWENKNRRSGKSAPNWAGGEQVYRTILLEAKTLLVCSKCGHNDGRVIVAHHKDGNRRSNKLENLEWLCRNCHYLAHRYPESP